MDFTKLSNQNVGIAVAAGYAASSAAIPHWREIVRDPESFNVSEQAAIDDVMARVSSHLEKTAKNVVGIATGHSAAATAYAEECVRDAKEQARDIYTERGRRDAQPSE